ncbi:MAG: Rdx family protein [Pirellulaceae bacterium]|nr:Rdx family protein [Pirellulaceae bacterium]
MDTYRQKIARMELIPSSGGCFELTLDGELVYSKLDTGEFPDETEMVNVVGQRL